MTAPIQLSVNIPFQGFYGSKWDDLVDSEVESYIEHIEDKNGDSECYNGDNSGYETYYPEEIRLDNLGDIAFDCLDHSAACAYIAADYAKSFGRHMNDLFEFDLGMKFEHMSRPREYNFETDRLFCDIPLKSVKALFAISAVDNHDSLRETIKERFTSYDGFCSFYDNTLATWLTKPLRDWDHNEVGTLLRACIALKTSTYDEDIEWTIYYELSENSNSYFDSSFDFDKFEEKRNEARQDLIDQLIEDDRDRAIELGLCAQNGDYLTFANWATRCPDTIDMFEPRAN